MTEQMPYNSFSTGLATAAAPESIDLNDDIARAVSPDVAIEAPRYIVFAGDMIPPSQKRERADLRTGGEYLGQAYKTLQRSKGLVRRCQITPMEPAFDFMSPDLAQDEKIHVVTTNNNAGAGNPLAAVRVYPGHEIAGIVRQGRESKGIVEITTLRGMEFNEVKGLGIQDAIFPEWGQVMAGYSTLPYKMKDLRGHLETRKKDISDTAIKDIIDTMLGSCDEFEQWGVGYLKTASMLVKVPANQGFVHTYSELAEQLFEMLDIRREDMLSRNEDIADIVARASSSGNGDMMAMALQKLADTQEMMAKFMAGQPQSPIAEVPDVKTDFTTTQYEVKDLGDDIVVNVPVAAKCSSAKANGEPCSGKPMANGLCVFHQPKDA